MNDEEKMMDKFDEPQKAFEEIINGMYPNSHPIQFPKRKIQILGRGPDNQLPELGQYVPYTGDNNKRRNKTLTKDEKIQYRPIIRKFINKLKYRQGKKKQKQIDLLQILKDFHPHISGKLILELDLKIGNIRDLMSETRKTLKPIGLTIGTDNVIRRVDTEYFLSLPQPKK